jgi:uncharacterized protein YbjT (DUF2867 family)
MAFLERHDMKIVVIGGTGLIGSKLVSALDRQGHEAIPASPDSGVNTLTGEGLAEVLDGWPRRQHRVVHDAIRPATRFPGSGA